MSIEMDPRISRHYLDLVAQETRGLLEKGFTPSGTSGDVSLRDPITGLIYVSGSLVGMPFAETDFSTFAAHDVSVHEPDGTNISPWALATIELPMHLGIYRARPDVHAIVHSHPLWASVFAITHETIPLALAEQMGNLGGEVNVAKYAPAGDVKMGAYIVEALGSKNAVIMANHGAVTVGPTFEVAYRYSYFLEQIAQKIIYAKLIGEIHALKPEDLNPDSYMKGTEGYGAGRDDNLE
ncbi:MAG: class II aldolase/adducin family protein [Clostridiales Family XIII bacterium]|jgi:ribulose-5-phosphate 4-epimerase/fuculose-1-phosphate aldolase|nr:class II aldolase/adducin family protein [Clostridiales Family XIII bacterium]